MKLFAYVGLMLTLLAGALGAQTLDTTKVKVPYDTTISTLMDSAGTVSHDTLVITTHDTLYVVSRDSTIKVCCKDSLVITPKPIPTVFNEPAGSSLIAELFGDKMPTGTFGPVLGSSGSWVANAGGRAILGPPTAIQIVYPSNFLAGRAPVQLEGWMGLYSSPPKFRTLYVRQDFKIGGTNGYENQSVGTKFGFISYGNPTYTARNQGFFFLKGTGVQQVMNNMVLVFVQQGSVDRTVQPNKASAIVTTGSWHRLEAVFGMNTLGQANGTLNIWIDGTMTHSYTNMVYAVSGAANPFQWYNFNPTWGGNDNRTRTRPDTLWMDHIRVSGKP